MILKNPNVAIIQQAPVFLNLEQSVTKAVQLIHEAANKGANIISFAECWLPGYPVWLDFAPNAALWADKGATALYKLLAENSVSLDDEHLARLQQTSDETGSHIIIGAHERKGGSLYNTTFYFSPGQESLPLHRKLMPTYTEKLVWGAGDGSTLPVIETDYGIIGSLICWEHWMPLARAAMHAKGEHIHVAQWPVVKDLHQMASRTYAFEGQCYVLAAGSFMSKRQVIEGLTSHTEYAPEAFDLLSSMAGGMEDLIHNGGSAIIAPDASYVVEPVFDQEMTLYADLDLGKITEGHLTMDTSGHYSRPDVFELSVDTREKNGVSFKE